MPIRYVEARIKPEDFETGLASEVDIEGISPSFQGLRKDVHNQLFGGPTGSTTVETPESALPELKWETYIPNGLRPERTGGLGTVANIGVTNTAAAVVGALEALSDGRFGTEARRKLLARAQRLTETLDDETRADMEAEWATEGVNTVLNNPDSIFTQFVAQLGNYAATIVPSLVGGAVGLAAGGPPGAVIGGAAAGALSEGTIVAGATYNDFAQGVEQAPEEILMRSPVYQTLRNNMDEADARKRLISIVGQADSLETGLKSAGFGAVGGAVLGRLLAPFKGAGLSRKARFGIGATSETLTEGPQEGYEQYRGNLLAQQTFDPTRTPGQGVRGAIAAGAVLSAGPGGVAGALTGGRNITGDESIDAALDESRLLTSDRAGQRALPLRTAVPLVPSQIGLDLRGGELSPAAYDEQIQRGGGLSPDFTESQEAELEFERQRAIENQGGTQLGLPLAGGTVTQEEIEKQTSRQKPEQVVESLVKDVEQEAARKAPKKVRPKTIDNKSLKERERVRGRIDKEGEVDPFPYDVALPKGKRGLRGKRQAAKAAEKALRPYLSTSSVSIRNIAKVLNPGNEATVMSTFTDDTSGLDLIKQALSNIIQGVKSNVTPGDRIIDMRDAIQVAVMEAGKSIEAVRAAPVSANHALRNKLARRAARDIVTAIAASRGIAASNSVTDAHLDMLMKLPSNKIAPSRFIEILTAYGDQAKKGVNLATRGDATNLTGFTTDKEVRKFLSTLNVNKDKENLPSLLTIARDRAAKNEKMNLPRNATKKQLIDLIAADVKRERAAAKTVAKERTDVKAKKVEQVRRGRKAARTKKEEAAERTRERYEPKKAEPQPEGIKKAAKEEEILAKKVTALSVLHTATPEQRQRWLKKNLIQHLRDAGLEFNSKATKDELVDLVASYKNEIETEYKKLIKVTPVSIAESLEKEKVSEQEKVRKARKELALATAEAEELSRQAAKEAEVLKPAVEAAMEQEFIQWVEDNPTQAEFQTETEKRSAVKFTKVPTTKTAAVKMLNQLVDYLKTLDKFLKKEKIPFGQTTFSKSRGMLVPVDVEIAQEIELAVENEGIGKARGKGRGNRTLLTRMADRTTQLLEDIRHKGWTRTNKSRARRLINDFNRQVPAPPRRISTKPTKASIKLSQAANSEYSNDYSDVGSVVRLLFNDGGATGDRVNLNGVLDMFTVGEGTHAEYLIQKIRNLNLQVGVRLVDELATDAQYDADTRTISIRRSTLASMAKGNQNLNSAVMGHAFLHEAVHAATLHALRTNVAAANEMQALFDKAKSKLPDSYGLTNVAEFIAEAFTNPKFRRDLASVRVTNKQGMVATVREWFVNLIRKALGFDTQFSTLLDEVLGAAEPLFTSEQQVQDIIANPEKYGDLLTSSKAPFIMETVQNVKDWTRITGFADKTRRIGLGLMSGRQIADMYNSIFNGLMDTWQTLVNAKESSIRRMLQESTALNNVWTEIKNKYKKQERVMAKLMGLSTLWGIHPDQKFNAVGYNDHLRDTPLNRSRHAKLQKMYYEQMNDPTRALYQQALKHYKDTRDRQVLQLRENIYGKFGVDQSYESNTPLNELTFNEKPLSDSAKKSISVLTQYANIKGPYFPLKRFGDWAVTAKLEETFTADTEEVLTQQLKDELAERFNPEEVDIRRAADGTWVGSFERDVFELHESPSAARRAIKRLQEAGYTDVSPVPQIKRDLYKSRDVPSMEFLNAVIRKMGAEDADGAAANALRTAYLEMLPETSLRKAEIRRKGTLGYSEDMQRVFASHATSSSYYLGQLEHGAKILDAVRDLREYTNIHKDGMQPVRSRVLQELMLRDKNEGKLTRPSGIWSKINDVGFVWFLLSPSYWFVNSTQPYMLTLPYLAARYGLKKSTVAMGKAYKEIMPEALRKSFDAKFGLDALSKLNTEQELFDVQKLIDRYRDRDSSFFNEGKADMLQFLADQNLLEISFAAALREEAGITTGKTKLGQTADTAWTQTMDLARSMPHIVEVMNRTVTGLAAYELAIKKGMDQQAAQRAARDAVADTQFDYGASNKPRYFSSRTSVALGPLLMFKQHAQHVYYTIIKSTLDLTRTKEERVRAAKHLTFLFSTHASMAGVIGATFEPIKWAIGLTAYLVTGDDDEPFDYEQWVREGAADIFGPKWGEVASRGLPRLFGADLSGRVGLHNMMFFDRNIGPSDRTAVETALITAMGPVVSIPSSIWNGIIDLREGDTIRGMERMTPKLFRDMLKVARLSRDGLTDATGNVMLDSKDISPLDYFYQLMGISPRRTAELYEARGAVMKSDIALNTRHKQLIETFRRSKNRKKVWREEILPFNHTNPAYRVTYAQLVRSLREKQRREREMRRTGGIYSDRKKRKVTREKLETYNIGE